MAATLSAGDALTMSGVEVSAVRKVLPLVEPYAVAIRPAPAWFRRLWAPGIVAVAMPWGVYVTAAVFDGLVEGSHPSRTGPLVVHELAHLQQFRRLGPLRHLTQYASDYVRLRFAGAGHWEAYRGIRLEAEARQVAAEFTEHAGPR